MSENELNNMVEWRWVTEDGRGMTEWKVGAPPPVLDLRDSKGAMRVEVRLNPNYGAGATP